MGLAADPEVIAEGVYFVTLHGISRQIQRVV